MIQLSDRGIIDVKFYFQDHVGPVDKLIKNIKIYPSLLPMSALFKCLNCGVARFCLRWLMIFRFIENKDDKESPFFFPFFD